MLRAVIIFGTTVVCANPAQAGDFAFSKITVPGDVFSYVNAINAADTVVGGYQLAAAGLPTHGFAWANGVTTLVTVPGETRQNSFVLVGVNKHGIAVGSFSDRSNGVQESVIYNLNTGDAKTIAPPAGYVLDAFAMSDTDIAAGSATPVSGGQSVIFTKTLGKPVMLLGTAFPPDDTLDFPRAVAASGEIVGVSNLQPGSTQQAFSYLNGGFAAVSPPAGGSYLYPDFVDSHGVIAGSYLAGATGPHGTPFPHGFIRRGSQLTTVDYPGTAGEVVSTIVAGVTRTGDVVGTYTVRDASGAATTHGFIRHHGVWSSFDVPGAVSTSVTAINGQGSVAGMFTDAKHVGHAFVGVCTADQAPCTQ